MASKREGFMFNIGIEEISFVKKPANRRKFVLTKNEGKQMDLMDIIRQTEAQGEEALVTLLKSRGASDETVTAVTALARLLTAFSDEIDGDTYAEIGKAVGFEAPVSDDDNGETQITKSDLERVPADVREKFAALEKRRQEDVDRLEKLEKAVNEARERERLAEYVEKAQGLSNLTRTAEEIGEMLKKTADSAGEEAATSLLEVLTAANEAANDNLFEERGSSRAAIDGDAGQRLNAIAEEIRKSDTSVSIGEAFDRALTQNPELAREYRSAFNSRN